MHPRKNEIYLIDAPFSDSGDSKRRPAVVVSRNGYNENEPDVIVCAVTSSMHPWAVQIAETDLEDGMLYPGSGARADCLLRVHKMRLLARIGKVKSDFHKKLVEKIIELMD